MAIDLGTTLSEVGYYASSTPVVAPPYTLSIMRYAPTAQWDNDLTGLLSVSASNSAYFALTTDLTTGVHTFQSKTAFFADAHTPSTVDEWSSIVGVASSTSNRRVYLNGVFSQSSTDVNAPSTPNKICIGFMSIGTPLWSFGLMAEACIWNVALTAAEVGMIGAHRIHPLLVRPANIVFYQPLLDQINPPNAVGPDLGNDGISAAPFVVSHPKLIRPTLPPVYGINVRQPENGRMILSSLS